MDKDNMEYPIPIRFHAPFRMGSGHGRAGLFDHSTQSDGRGWLYLPGSAIKGRLRHLCHRVIVTLAEEGVASPLKFTELCPAKARTLSVRFCRGAPCAFCRLFGSPIHSGMYRFLDGVLADNEGMDMGFVTHFSSVDPAYLAAVQTEPRTQVSIERSRGVAKRARLFTSENGASYLSFLARVTGPEDEEVQCLLDYACACLTHLGAGAGIGLGRIESGGER